MDSSHGEQAPSGAKRKPSLGVILQKLRKRRIVETLAAFIAGGWLLVEVVERLLVEHYGFPKQTIDLTVVTVVGALLATLVWRWFRSAEKRPGNIKVEVLLVPLIILATVAVDLNIIFRTAGISGHALPIALIALCLGIAWVILKLSQWASAMPGSGKEEADTAPPISERPEKSIVVLPFTDLSPQKDQGYFCDGITEEIIADLSCCHELLVISRSSAMTFKESPKTVREIAKELNVGYALEGSVRKAGNDLRITAQLIDASSDVHLWGDKYVGTLPDIFDIQEKVSRTIVDALKLRLTPQESRRIGERPTNNIAAYDLYLRANAEIFGFTEDGLGRAGQLLQKGLEIIGDNPLLDSTLAYVYCQYVNIGIKQEDYIAKAERYAHKALSLDPDSSQAHTVLGVAEQFRGDQRAGLKHFKKALAAYPNDPAPLISAAVSYIQVLGQFSAGDSFVTRLMAVDPLNPLGYLCAAAIHLYQGQYDLALEFSQKCYRIDPGNPVCQFYHAWILSYRNKDDARSLIDRHVTEQSDNVISKMGLMLKYALIKDRERVFQEMTSNFQRTCQRDPEWSHYVSFLLALVDAKEEAIAWLENAVRQGLINYPALEWNPYFMNIRAEPRFIQLMERVKYEWKHFEE